ncbi:3-dehydroquinate synthase [Altererythrobacter aurantiacus]|uniref:3-dehydroquinate synthase n=1 Tax=Parapontixanthobacter aurantiacus TaxID=1463599 RepID=A0A844ZBC0_9SPHN|nr:3-dehydroquinate synthase [Parapontixanthobacter aurantiacus]MXO85098.1 3-dehydroquinate synthase [Parapontixanthobacter aurantiacus]
MAVIKVALGGRSYDVVVEPDILPNFAAITDKLLKSDTVCVVADERAWAEHGRRLEASLAQGGREIALYEVASGEGSKSWSELEKLTDWLLEKGVERSDNVIAFGGGVVGDLTGFACSILKRGCGFIQVPTTLLAQVDSSVGGKTAINTKAGKNLVGAFHQPNLVLADITTLSSLPPREMRAGYAEVIKYGILGNLPFFEWCERHGPALVAGDTALLEEAVAQSVSMKAAIVAEDERETTGKRALLNLGHTFGHALEAETGFGNKLLHGEAVALGMVLAARYSARLGNIARKEAERITRALDAAGLPSEISALSLDCDGETLVGHMLHDKKMEGGTLPFILLDAIGKARLDRNVVLDDVAAFLTEELQAH